MKHLVRRLRLLRVTYVWVREMVQLIIKDKQIKCRTTVPYPPDVIKAMKKAGYKIKEIPDENVEGEIKNVSKRKR